jgi:hypothetical protein
MTTWYANLSGFTPALFMRSNTDSAAMPPRLFWQIRSTVVLEGNEWRTRKWRCGVQHNMYTFYAIKPSVNSLRKGGRLPHANFISLVLSPSHDVRDEAGQ